MKPICYGLHILSEQEDPAITIPEYLEMKS